MARLACVDVPYLALQILLKDEPAWVEHPVAVVDDDRPQGIILEVNRLARDHKVLPGMRYAAGLSLARELRARVVSRDRVDEVVEELLDTLMQRFSPHVEPSDDEAGVFWMRIEGLDRLFGSYDAWCAGMLEALRGFGVHVAVCAGFTRFGTYAIARAMRPGKRVMENPHAEDRVMRSVPLALLEVDAGGRDKLAKLGVTRVGELLQLPPTGIRQRYGEQIEGLRKMAAGEAELPVSPVPWASEVHSDLDFAPAEDDVHRLVFRLKGELHRHMLELAARHSDLAELELLLDIEDGDGIEVSVRPASPTLEDSRVLELLRLKLETVTFTRGIVRARMRSVPTRSRRPQLPLFGKTNARTLDDANHALARLRAEFGDEAVVRVKLGNSHLPEGRFVFEPLDAMRTAEPRQAPRRLIRRIRERPTPLPRFDEEILPGWLVAGLDAGPVVETWGPYELSGGWWSREAHRAYHFVRTRRGDLYWVFFDHRRKQWFLHGEVE